MANQPAPLDAVFHSLADPTRRAVVTRLLQGEAPVKQLAQPFAIGLPAFLKHLAVLEGAGLIRSEKRGRVRTCRIDAERLADRKSVVMGKRVSVRVDLGRRRIIKKKKKTKKT